jgi:hypothetical protein
VRLGQLIANMLADGEAAAGNGGYEPPQWMLVFWPRRRFPRTLALLWILQNFTAQTVNSGISEVHRKSAYRPFGTRIVHEMSLEEGNESRILVTMPGITAEGLNLTRVQDEPRGRGYKGVGRGRPVDGARIILAVSV